MNNSKNYYDILGVTKIADEKTIKTAYRNLSKLHHPDKGGNAEIFKNVSEAYSILSDKKQRLQYDYNQKTKNTYSSHHTNTNSNTRDVDFDINMEDILNRMNRDFFGNYKNNNSTNSHKNSYNESKYKHREEHIENLDIERNIDISLEDIYSNNKIEVNYMRNTTCYKCKGIGIEESNFSIDCLTCDSKGYINKFGMNIKCDMCNGEGKIHTKGCSMCNGEKISLNSDYVILDNIHTMTQNTRIVKRGFGNHSKQQEGRYGNLNINIIPKKDPRYQIEGKNVIFTLYLDFKTAILGGVYEYTHLDMRKYNINIPSKTNSGSRFKLDGLGLLHTNKLTRGDLVLEVVLKIDYSKLNSEDLEFLKKVGV